MNLFEKYRDWKLKKKFGEITDEYHSPPYHISGPVDGTLDEVNCPMHGPKPVGAVYNIDDIVDPSLIQEGEHERGRVYCDNYKNAKQKYEAELIAFRALADAYLNGRFEGHSGKLPINDDVFFSGVDREKINETIELVKSLKNVEVTGKVVKKFSRGQKDPETAEDAQQYLKDLAIWELPFWDYSDYWGLNITQREKEDENGKRLNLIVERHWSCANQGPSGRGKWTPVDVGREKIVISGYKK